jgi:anti-sigma factor RsiW
MNCSPFDLRDFFFGELAAADKRQVEQHLAVCSKCSEELAGLDVMRTAMLTVREEEPPRRIAFVSDKVFEPRWWQSLWSSGSRLGFASAALLSTAIFVHSFATPAAIPVPAPQVDQAAIEGEIQRRVDVAVQKASAQLEQRYETKLRQVVAEQRKELRFENRANLVSMQEYADTLQKRMRMVQRASYDSPGAIQ